jgi:dUTP pyrophosphatase
MGILDDLRDKLSQAISNEGGYTIKDFEDEANKLNNDIDISNIKINVDFKNVSNNEDPKYSHEMDSGFDLRANITEPIIIEQFGRKLIPTGLFFNLPYGFELQVRSRSGLALKNGIFVLNSPGTVDNYYTNEIGIILCNLGEQPFIVNHGDRIAQGVISNIFSTNIIRLNKVNEIVDNQHRSTNGFGSTGVK